MFLRAKLAGPTVELDKCAGVVPVPTEKRVRIKVLFLPLVNSFVKALDGFANELGTQPVNHFWAGLQAVSVGNRFMRHNDFLPRM